VLEAEPFAPADQPVSRDRIILKDQLGGVDAFIAELLKLAADLKAIAFFGDEQTHPFVPRLGGGVGLDEQGKTLAVDSVRNPGLGTIDHVHVAAAAGYR